MKVLKVLNGILSKEDVSQLTLIKEYSVLYSGSVEAFQMAYKDKSDIMHDCAKEYASSEVIARDFNCGSKLFLWIR